MNNYIKKNINIILCIFILLQPLLDLLTGVCIHSLKINLTIGIIVRVLFLLFICIITLFTFKKKKILIPYLIIGLYFIFYTIGIVLFGNKNMLFTEIQGLIKTFYFPILLISLHAIRNEIKVSKMVLFTSLFMYLILIFIPTILGIGYQTYEIAKAGTLGFFNSANEIGGIISLLTPIMFIIFYYSKNIIPKVILVVMYLTVILMMGTKTPLLALMITIGMSLLYKWIKLIKEKKYKSIIISLSIVIIGIIGLIIVMPKSNFYKNIQTHLDYLKVEKITDIFKEEELIDHFIFSQRLTFLRNKSKLYNKSNIYQKVFGIGYTKDNKATKLIEMDYFDILYSHGVAGFIIFFIIMIYVLYRLLKKEKQITYEKYMTHVSLLLIIFLSFFTGHIITAPSVSLISIILIISLVKRDKKDLLFADHSMQIGGIEMAQLNLLNNLDYNKYNVVLILEEKKGELLDKINKHVIIKELKVSNNKNVIIRKFINAYRKLVFKIFNYMNYDFSCCYTTYSYSSNKVARIASINNSIYIHSDYKYIYSTEKEYKEFFDTRKINDFKSIIFVSNESKKSFLEYYPNLKDKTIVLNNLINVKQILDKSKEKIKEEKGSKKLFVYVGRLDDSSKKLKRAIKLLKELDIELWIIGDGPDRKMYEDYAKELKINNQIKFLGKKENPYPYMLKADYIILTSDYEGFPVTYLEAIALNKKIITTIKTSDDQIDIEDYAYIIPKEEDKMKKEVEKILKSKSNKKTINLEKIQTKRIKQFEKLFN